MANLRDHLKIEIDKGTLQEPFTAAQLRNIFDNNGMLSIGGAKHESKHIGTYLANLSTGPGNRLGESVKRGVEKLFIRHEERGVYSLDYETYDLDEEDIKSLAEDELNANLITTTLTEFDIAYNFVEYIRNKPYRTLKIRNKKQYWSPSQSVTGWANRLNYYCWNGATWNETKIILDEFIGKLAHLEGKYNPDLPHQDSIDQSLIIYNEIRKWGNPKGPVRTGKEVLEILVYVWNNEINQVDSTLTKLYALARPNEYVIYDSRVSTAILAIAEDIYRWVTRGVTDSKNTKRIDAIIDFQAVFQNLGLYNGSGGTRPRTFRSQNWPQAYTKVKAQYDANRLCKLIVAELNILKEDSREWTIREVEAVLFMEGY